MAKKLITGDLHFEDVAAGDWFDTPHHVMTSGEIDRFAELTGDRFEIHMDESKARALGFPARVAHGLLVLSIVDGLKNNSEAGFAAVASLGWNWKFLKPVFPQDMIQARITVIEKRLTRKPDRGIVRLAFSAKNHHGEEVQAGTNELMVLTRNNNAVSGLG